LSDDDRELYVKELMSAISKIKIFHQPWPELETLENGTWKRVWKILFQENVDFSFMKETTEAINNDIALYLSSINCLFEPEEDDFVISIEVASSKEIYVTVITIRDGWSDEFFPTTHKMFESISKRIGKIDKIEREPTKVWMQGFGRKFIY
jgi:predicted secreted protein